MGVQCRCGVCPCENDAEPGSDLCVACRYRCGGEEGVFDMTAMTPKQKTCEITRLREEEGWNLIRVNDGYVYVRRQG